MRTPGAPSHRGRREAAGPVRSLRAALGAAVVFVACAATPSSDVRAWAPSSSAEAGTVASTAGVRGSLRDAIASARTALAKRPPTAETRDAQAALAGLSPSSR